MWFQQPAKESELKSGLLFPTPPASSFASLVLGRKGDTGMVITADTTHGHESTGSLWISAGPERLHGRGTRL